MILIVARQEYSSFDSLVIVHELELRLARVGRPKTSYSAPPPSPSNFIAGHPKAAL